jgi:hypothetical protein
VPVGRQLVPELNRISLLCALGMTPRDYARTRTDTGTLQDGGSRTFTEGCMDYSGTGLLGDPDMDYSGTRTDLPHRPRTVGQRLRIFTDI